jgi:hypothetical protein
MVSPVRGDYRRRQAEIPLIVLCRFPGPAVEWARRAQESFGGRVGYIPGTIYHLWHGNLVNRNYMGRHELMAGFDPDRDIQQAPNGVWLWSDPHSELARNVKDYFRSRKEDG